MYTYIQVIVQRALSAKSLGHATGGTIFAAGLKILPPFLMVFPGLMARYMNPVRDCKRDVAVKYIYIIAHDIIYMYLFLFRIFLCMTRCSFLPAMPFFQNPKERKGAI